MATDTIRDVRSVGSGEYIFIRLSREVLDITMIESNDITRRAVLTAIAAASIGTAGVGTASAKPAKGKEKRKGGTQVIERIHDNPPAVLNVNECLDGPSEFQREYLEGTLKANLILQHDGDLESDEAVRVRGSIGGELEPRYGSGVWRAQVHFGSQYGYVQSLGPPREIYVLDAEVVARPIRGDGDRPTIQAPVWIEIINGGVVVSGRGPAECYPRQERY